MTYFIHTQVEIPGVGLRERYTAPRDRDGTGWTFYSAIGGEWVYSPTWPEAVHAAFPGVEVFALIVGGVIALDFLEALTFGQEDTLDDLYAAHVAPVPVEA